MLIYKQIPKQIFCPFFCQIAFAHFCVNEVCKSVFFIAKEGNHRIFL